MTAPSLAPATAQFHKGIKPCKHMLAILHWRQPAIASFQSNTSDEAIDPIGTLGRDDTGAASAQQQCCTVIEEAQKDIVDADETEAPHSSQPIDAEPRRTGSHIIPSAVIALQGHSSQKSSGRRSTSNTQ
jgi:hypothetical protein